MLMQLTKQKFYRSLRTVTILAALMTLGLYLVPYKPSEWDSANNCKPIAQEHSEAQGDQKNPSPIVANTKSTQTKPPNSTRNKPDENIQIQREIAAYTCELAVYTANVSGFTRLLVYVTACVVFVGVAQGYWLYAAVEESARQHIATNKAFVFVRHWIFLATGKTKDIDFWRITPVWENSGDTPTKYLSSYQSGALMDGEPPKDFKYPDTAFPAGQEVKISHDFIGPRGQLNGAPFNLAIADVLEMRKGTKKFFIWGWFDYNDLFKGTERHRTEYCCQILVVLDPTNPNNVALSASIYGWHNAVDDQCYRKPSPYTPPERPA
ncbi:MAG: hypothetical protein ABSG46_08695 [Candidatus Binataceae bacterium]|jgi:hypothetical protein